MSNTRFHKLTLIVPEDRRLVLQLPDDFPAGPAELIVLSAAAVSAAAVSAAAVSAATGAPPQSANRAEPRTSVLDELRSRLRNGRETHGWEELDAIRLRRKRGSARFHGSGRTGGTEKQRSPGRG